MIKKKLLITGISGFLGNQFVKRAKEKYQLIGTFHSKPVDFLGVETYPLDIQDHEATNVLIEQVKPDALFHFAALSNPNFCEQNIDLSMSINVLAAEYLAQLCQVKNIPFVFTSTDLVFDGQAAPYTTDSPADAICLYGKHKRIAEQKILSLYPKAIIARCPLMYGFAKTAPNSLSNWVNQMREGNTIGAFTDEYRTTASGESVVDGLLLLLEKKVSGIWHLGGKEKISRYDFAMKMAAVFNLDKALIRAVKQVDIEMPAPRPANVSMDSSKTYDLGFNPPKIDEELRRLFR